MRTPPSDFTDQQRRWLMDLIGSLDREIRISTVGVYYTAAVNASAAATPWVITWNGDLLANAFMHSTTVNNTRLIAPEAGLYEVYACALVDAAIATTHFLSVKLNGAFLCNIDKNVVNTNGQFTSKGLIQLSLAKDDYVEIQSNSTAAFNTYGNATAARCTSAFMRLLPV